MVGGLNIVQWGTDKSGKSVQVGLSPGQTRGSVSGVIVTRPASQDVNTVYSPGVGSTSTKIDREGNATTIKKDQYGNVIEVTQRGSSGNLIFQRKTTLYSGSVESGLPGEVAKNIQDIQTQQESLAQYRKAAEYAKAQKLQQQQTRQQPTPAFQLPGLSDLFQNRYVKPPKEKEYYAVQHPSGFGKVQLYSEYKPTDRFKLFGVIPAGSPEPGGLYKSDILGFTKRVGSINQTEARELAAKPHKTTSVMDLKLNHAGNMLLFSPFAFGSMPVIKLPAIKSVVTSQKKGIMELLADTSARTGSKRVKVTERATIPDMPTANDIKLGSIIPYTKKGVVTPKGGSIWDAEAVKIRNQIGNINLRATTKKPAFSEYQFNMAKKSELRKLAIERIVNKPRSEISRAEWIEADARLNAWEASKASTQPSQKLNNFLMDSKPSTTGKTVVNILNNFKPSIKKASSVKQPFILSSIIGLGVSQRPVYQQRTGTKPTPNIKTNQVPILNDILRNIQISGIKPYQSYSPSFSFIQSTKQTTKQRTPENPPYQPPSKPPGKPGVPRIPKVPIIKIPSLELPEFTLGTSGSKKKGLKYKKIKTKMLTLKDLLGKK